MAEEEPVFEADGDQFKGVLLKPRHYGVIVADVFERRLKASLAVWGSQGRRGVWVRIPLNQSELIPAAAKLGFQFHHAHPDHIMMTLWLPRAEPNNLPGFAYHYIGVAGFVVNEKEEVLLVQERWLQRMSIQHWKLPGGHTERGEELWQTAIRETLEETGVRSEFVAMLCFRHMHDYRWGTNDIYFACLLRPLNHDISINTAEIADAKWMSVDAYMADPGTSATNLMIAQAYKDGLARDSFIQPTTYSHFLPSRKDLVFYHNQPRSKQNQTKEEGERESSRVDKSGPCRL